jgi:putative transposase
MSLPIATRKSWISPKSKLSIRKQSQLAGLSRSHYYYNPVPESEENLKLMRLIDEQYLRHPEFGYPRMTDWVISQGFQVNHKRVSRLMKLMGLQAITPGPHTSKPSKGHKTYPYLLRNVKIDRVGQVWSTDITFVGMQHGYLYLTAVIDWYSRYVLSWDISNTMDNTFCISVLKDALSKYSKPEIFNTDQGSQYTSLDFTSVLNDKEISISMDGKGRALDNVFIERLWWTVKYENIYPNVYEDGIELFNGLSKYFKYYNLEREHSSLGKRTPSQIYKGGASGN